LLTVLIPRLAPRPLRLGLGRLGNQSPMNLPTKPSESKSRVAEFARIRTHMHEPLKSGDFSYGLVGDVIHSLAIGSSVSLRQKDGAFSN
jgi:hypothetical protein